MVSLGELGGVAPETPPPRPKQWWVSARWLMDMDKFNEWMNEEDYELVVVVSGRGRKFTGDECGRGREGVNGE